MPVAVDLPVDRQGRAVLVPGRRVGAAGIPVIERVLVQQEGEIRQGRRRHSVLPGPVRDMRREPAAERPAVGIRVRLPLLVIAFDPIRVRPRHRRQRGGPRGLAAVFLLHNRADQTVEREAVRHGLAVLVRHRRTAEQGLPHQRGDGVLPRQRIAEGGGRVLGVEDLQRQRFRRALGEQRDQVARVGIDLRRLRDAEAEGGVDRALGPDPARGLPRKLGEPGVEHLAVGGERGLAGGAIGPRLFMRQRQAIQRLRERAGGGPVPLARPVEEEAGPGLDIPGIEVEGAQAARILGPRGDQGGGPLPRQPGLDGGNVGGVVEDQEDAGGSAEMVAERGDARVLVSAGHFEALGKGGEGVAAAGLRLGVDPPADGEAPGGRWRMGVFEGEGRLADAAHALHGGDGGRLPWAMRSVSRAISASRPMKCCV